MLLPDTLEDALGVLGEVLLERGEVVRLAVVGGGALLLARLVRRPTKDLDVVAFVDEGLLLSAEPFPPALQKAVEDVARALELAPDWLNPGPTSILSLGLPEGFLRRCTRLRFGSLDVYVADRVDQIALKLFAAADHWPARLNKHLDDLRRLKPTTEELLAAASWCRTHDPGEGFSTLQLSPVLLEFGVEHV